MNIQSFSLVRTLWSAVQAWQLFSGFYLTVISVLPLKNRLQQDRRRIQADSFRNQKVISLFLDTFMKTRRLTMVVKDRIVARAAAIPSLPRST